MPHFAWGLPPKPSNLAEYAEAKRTRKKLPLLVGNLAQDTLGQDAAELVLFDDQGQHRIAAGRQTHPGTAFDPPDATLQIN